MTATATADLAPSPTPRADASRWSPVELLGPVVVLVLGVLLLRRSNRLAYAGLVALALAIAAAVLLVTDVLFSRTQAWITAAVVAALLTWWWIAVPLWQRAHNEQDRLRDEG